MSSCYEAKMKSYGLIKIIYKCSIQYKNLKHVKRIKILSHKNVLQVYNSLIIYLSIAHFPFTVDVH